MKYLFFLAYLFLSTSLIQAQDAKEELLDQLGDETCECMDGREITAENMEMVIGLCILQASNDKVDDIKSILGYELFKEEDMVSLGEAMGMRMIFSCEILQTLMLDATEEGEIDDSFEEDSGLGGEPTKNADGEAWVFLDRPVEEEEYGDGPSSEMIDDFVEEVFPPTEEEWVDIDRPIEEEEYGNGSGVEIEEIGDGGTAERFFITESLPNTNRTAINYPVIAGQIKKFDAGVFSKVIIKDDSGKEFELYLIDNVPGAGFLSKRAKLNVMYREVQRFDASTGDPRAILEIVRVDEQ
ncbi:MAG: hypothetical protein AAF741_02555 [Bacteroidota bacterium]